MLLGVLPAHFAIISESSRFSLTPAESNSTGFYRQRYVNGLQVLIGGRKIFFVPPSNNAFTKPQKDPCL